MLSDSILPILLETIFGWFIGYGVSKKFKGTTQVIISKHVGDVLYFDSLRHKVSLWGLLYQVFIYIRTFLLIIELSINRSNSYPMLLKLLVMLYTKKFEIVTTMTVLALVDYLLRRFVGGG